MAADQNVLEAALLMALPKDDVLVVYELDNVLIPLVTRHEFVQRGRRPDTIQFEMVPEGVHVACEHGASLGEETHDCAMGLVIGLLSRLSIGTTLSIW